MFMKRLIYYMMLLVLGGGCNMTLLPETEITEDDILKNMIDVRKTFLAAYELDEAISAKIDCDRGLADDMIPAYESLDQAIDFYEMDADGMYKNQNVEALYSGFYRSIAICNQTLNLLDKCVVTDTVQWKQIRGEALALRAFDHFSLVNYFGRPYYDHPETNLGIVLKTEFDLGEAARTNVQTVYDTIVSDLKRARDLMTLEEDHPARFTADGATALLCRVYLFMNKWDMVVEEASKLIGKYEFPSDLVGQFEEINGEGEIFTLDFSYNTSGFYYPYGEPAGQFKDIFHDGDYRFDSYIIEDIDFALDENGDFIFNDDGSLMLIEISKFDKIRLTYKALRIVEVYLNRAEAYCELGEYDLARADLLEVAGHSGADVTYINALTGKALLDEILTERHRELAGEGHRASDLLRKGLPVVRYYSEEESWTEEPVQTIAADDFSRILPIPHQECYLNTKVQQNPGYPRSTKL